MQTAVIVLSGVVSLCLVVIVALWILLLKTAAMCCEAEASELRLKKENGELREKMKQTAIAINQIGDSFPTRNAA